MRLDSRSGLRGLVIDLDTGRPVSLLVIWADIPEDPRQQGEYEAWRRDPDLARRNGATVPELLALKYRGRARMQFVPAAPVFRPRASEARDLTGSLAEARSRVDQRLLVLAEECAEPRCHKLAEYRVCWEQLIEPHTDADGRKHERAVVTRVLSWCSAHYRQPVRTNLRGVQSEVPVEVGRPQWER